LKFLHLSEGKNSSGGEQQQSQRFPLTGTIEEIGKDIQRIKEMDAGDIMFAFVGLELDKVIDIAKQLGRYVK
jgi:hypothetical protein